MSARPVTDAERAQAATQSAAEAPNGTSGRCVCSTCIHSYWRPRWRAERRLRWRAERAMSRPQRRERFWRVVFNVGGVLVLIVLCALCVLNVPAGP